MQNLVSISVFGILGVLCRYGLDKFMVNENQAFPLPTFTINILGSFLAGLVYAVGERQEISPILQVGLLVGFCGGFTTFSTYALQTFTMIDRERLFPAIAYLVTSPILGLLAASAPILVIRKLSL